MNEFAMWIGYAVMVIAAIAALAVAGSWAVQQMWREIRREAPSLRYISEAVAHYKTVKPAPDALLSDDEQHQRAIDGLRGKR